MNVNVKRRLGVDTTNGIWTKNKRDDQPNTFGTNKHGFRSNEMHGRHEKYRVKGAKDFDKRIASEVVELSSNSEPILENKNDKEENMERAAFKSLEVFNDVLDKPRVSRMEMEERIQKLAKCLNGADINMPEWMFSKMMRSAKIRFSDHSILRVIQILGKLGNWRRVLQVIEWIQMRERFKSHKIRYIYTAALDALGKARRPVEALNVFNAMQQHMSSYPDLVAYHCIAVTLGQAGHLKELFEVIDNMRSPPKKKFKIGVLEKWDPRLEPDIVVYNAVLNACVQRKQWEGAFWVLQQLKQQGQQPSSTTYGLVMEVMFACGKYNLVHDFFKKVQKSSFPNALTYKVVVNTLWREDKTDEAILAVQDMERRGVIGSAGLYYDLARCLCSVGRCQEALMQIDKICKVANKPLVVTYTGLIQACLDGGNVQNGAYIFNHMRKFCCPNLVTCNIMLKAYLENGMFEEAKELFQKMSENVNHISSKEDCKDRVIPDIYTFNTMLDACAAKQRWNDLEYVYKQMLHHGYHFNAKRHLRMILDTCRAGKGELLETTWKHFARADRTPPPLLIKEMFRMKLEQDDHAAALSCIASHCSSESLVFSHKAWLNFFKENAHRFRKGTLVSLIHEGSILISRNDSQNPIFQNLITACREFLRTHITDAGIDQTEALSRLQSETALKF
uniref:Pentatricopeptide repeat-containing protein n=1 Tax=Davidia involucrata TaxID=16924 RepID=A0A5B6Z6E5_DAVIN